MIVLVTNTYFRLLFDHLCQSSSTNCFHEP